MKRLLFRLALIACLLAPASAYADSFDASATAPIVDLDISSDLIALYDDSATTNAHMTAEMYLRANFPAAKVYGNTAQGVGAGGYQKGIVFTNVAYEDVPGMVVQDYQWWSLIDIIYYGLKDPYPCTAIVAPMSGLYQFEAELMAWPYFFDHETEIPYFDYTVSVGLSKGPGMGYSIAGQHRTRFQPMIPRPLGYGETMARGHLAGIVRMEAGEALFVRLRHLRKKNGQPGGQDSMRLVVNHFAPQHPYLHMQRIGD